MSKVKRIFIISFKNTDYSHLYLSDGKYTPAWITEFGRSPDTVSNGGGDQFIKSVINYLDNEPRVERYAYLARFDPNNVNTQRDLQNADGSKTALGNVYIS